METIIKMWAMWAENKNSNRKIAPSRLDSRIR